MTQHLVHMKLALLRWKPAKKAEVIKLFDRADTEGLVEHITLHPVEEPKK